MRRMLVALGHDGFRPTDDQRQYVRVLALNRVPHERIARLLGITMIELQFSFSDELDLAEDEILAVAAANVLELAAQRTDLGVAYRANEMILKTRLAVWREPKQAEEQAGTKRISDMSLEEVEREIDRLERAKARTAAAEEDDPPQQGKPN